MEIYILRYCRNLPICIFGSALHCNVQWLSNVQVHLRNVVWILQASHIYFLLYSDFPQTDEFVFQVNYNLLYVILNKHIVNHNAIYIWLYRIGQFFLMLQFVFISISTLVIYNKKIGKLMKSYYSYITSRNYIISS